jgi:hypothetical protein
MSRERHNGNGYYEEEETVPYASYKNGQRAHGRNQRHEYMGGERAYADRDSEPRERKTMNRRSKTSSIMIPLLVLGGFAVLAGVMQAVVPRAVDAIGGMFSKD